MDIAALINRVHKNQQKLRKWAKRENLEAYRLYDRDMPEFPLAIDRYGDALHMQVFERKRPLEDDQITAIENALREKFALSNEQLASKTRKRQRGLSQYEKLGEKAAPFLVQERQHQFEVDLHQYLDTGLFLDHRNTRQMVAEQASGANVLNLFAYTGSFTVYAAAAGAKRTVTVDMSRTYQDWSQRNLKHNGLADAKRHQFVQSDALGFLQRMKEARARFDLIVLDPPSFSNSKRMHNTFDVQRDQVALLNATLAVLAPGGTLYFSNNRQGFKLDEQIQQRIAVEEITDKTIPSDFSRHRPHRCWKMTNP